MNSVMAIVVPRMHCVPHFSQAGNVVFFQASKASLSRTRRVVIIFLCYMPEPNIQCFLFRPSCTLCTFFRTTSETESTAMTSGSFCETRGARSRFSSSASADEGNLVCDSAEDVEDQIIGKQRRPWTYHHNAQEQLTES